MSEKSELLRKQILELTAQYHAEAFPVREFVPGVSTVPVSGKVIGADDIGSVVESALDGWFTTGRWAKDFERKLARFFGLRSASLVNSGSSAAPFAAWSAARPIFPMPAVRAAVRRCGGARPRACRVPGRC